MGRVLYRVKEVNQDGNSSYSNIVSVFLQNKRLVIYPNPVKDNTIKVQLNNFNPGTYTIHIYNSTGAIVHNRNVNHAGGAMTHNVMLSKKLPVGIYNVVVVDPSGTRNSMALLVQ